MECSLLCIGKGLKAFLLEKWLDYNWGRNLAPLSAPFFSINQQEDAEAKCWAADKQGDPSIYSPSTAQHPLPPCVIHNIKQDSELSIGSSLNRMIANHLLHDPWKTVAVRLHWLGDSAEGERAEARTPEGESVTGSEKGDSVGSFYGARPHN